MINREGDRLRVSGRLTMETAATLFDIGAHLVGEGDLVIDLAQVEVVDSSSVSLLLVWLREARRGNVNMCYAHLPENLASLAKLYGVLDLLPLCQDNAAPV